MDLDVTPAPATPLTEGQILEGKYLVGKPLGGGAMGLVYEAQHLLLQKPVAVKVLRPELAAVDDVRERFEAEARAAAAIGHPNIISVTDMGRTPDGALYFVMDRLRGETLGARLERAGRMEAANVVATALELLSGLGAAHALGLIHRDIKPDNIFFAQSPGGRETPRILDFGIAKALASVGKRVKGTRAGFTVGTPQYMAPEQAAGAADVDVRVDVYAMGVVMYYMLAGRPPFDGEDVMQVLTAVVSGAAPPLAKFCPEAPPELVRLVESAMHKDRNRRPPTAGDFATLLKTALTARAAAASEPRKPMPAPPAADATFRESSAVKALAAPVLVDLATRASAPSRPRTATGPSNRPDAVLELDRSSRPSPGVAATTLTPPGQIRTGQPEPVPRPRPKWPWLIPIPVFALVAMIVVPRMRGDAVRPAAEVEAPSARKVTIIFKVTPEMSEIFVDGAKEPSTNPVMLTEGPHRAIAKYKGYLGTPVQFDADRDKTITLDLEKLGTETHGR